MDESDEPVLTTPSPVLGPARKPKTSIYIILLIVALVAMVVGCAFLLAEINRNGGFGSVRGRVSAVQPASNSRVAYSAFSSASGCRAPSSRSNSSIAAASPWTSSNLWTTSRAVFSSSTCS